MKDKFTPGPWRVGKFGICNTNGWIIADLAESVMPDDQKAANANLMAAAPDLFALALEVEWVTTIAADGAAYYLCPWCNCDRKSGGHADDCRRQAAIAKARGEKCES